MENLPYQLGQDFFHQQDLQSHDQECIDFKIGH